jgi:uncharacterized protein (TIGR03067 family)
MRLPIPFCFLLLTGIVCCLPTLLADDAKPKEEAKDDSKLLEGSWNGIGLEADGKKVPAEVLEKLKGRFTFKGLELLMTDTTPVSGAKATVKLDSSKTPKQIDLTGIEGTGKGKTIQGIYKLEKDRLFICLRGPEFVEKGRPTEFKTEVGSGLGLMTLERTKE